MSTKKRILLTVNESLYNRLDDYYKNQSHACFTLQQLILSLALESLDRKTNSYTAIAKEKIEYRKKKDSISPLDLAKNDLEAKKAKEKAQIMSWEAEVVERGGYVCIDPDGGTLLVGILPVYKNNGKESVRIDYKEKVYLDELEKFPLERQFHHSDARAGSDEAKALLDEIIKKSGQTYYNDDLALINPN